MKVRGNNIILFYQKNGEWKTIAYGSTCEIDINAEAINVSSPDTGKWTSRKKRKLDWSINAAYLLSNVIQEVELYDLLESSETVKIYMGSVEAHESKIIPQEYKIDGKYALTGDAMITRLTIGARKGDMVTVSASFSGCGKLEQIRPPWILGKGTWNMSGLWINWKNWITLN